MNKEKGATLLAGAFAGAAALALFNKVTAKTPENSSARHVRKQRLTLST